MVPISNFHLALSFLPVIVVLAILWHWKLGYLNAIYAVGRMLVQLLLVGYCLAFITKADRSIFVLGALVLMLLAASWISLRTVNIPRQTLFLYSLLSIAIGGGTILILITQGVLCLDPWYLPSKMIPLGGMIFASGMNSISLAAERLEAERSRDVPYLQARNIALNGSLIPIMNSLFAVGLVSIPGMMTGQLLTGADPFIAARYQIMVMCMVFGSAGISVAMFLLLVKPHFVTK